MVLSAFIQQKDSVVMHGLHQQQESLEAVLRADQKSVKWIILNFETYCLCGFNTCKYNSACKALYDRIVVKGKSKKLALIGVCNKLLKQAFAIVKKGLPYDENFVSKLA